MSIKFFAISPNGIECDAVPIGTDHRLQNWHIDNLDEVVVPFNRMYVHFDDLTHETGMVSLHKPASFTISKEATDNNLHLTRRDVIDQLKAIVYHIYDHPSIFGLRAWTKLDKLFIQSIRQSNQGYWTAFIHPNYIGLDMLDDPDAKRNQDEVKELAQSDFRVSYSLKVSGGFV